MVAAALGWLGTVGTFVAYILLVRGRITAASTSYAAMNLGGSVFAGTASFVYHAWPSVASNIVWGAVGVHTLLVTLKRRAALLRARRRAARAAATGVGRRAILGGVRRHPRSASVPAPRSPQPRRESTRPGSGGAGGTGPGTMTRRRARRLADAGH